MPSRAFEAVPPAPLASESIDKLTTCFVTDFHKPVKGYPACDATLEVIKGTMCPRFHADVVEVRAICTLAGPGEAAIGTRVSLFLYGLPAACFNRSQAAVKRGLPALAGPKLATSYVV